jgi:proliferating cell nuclear antigen PCNA
MSTYFQLTSQTKIFESMIQNLSVFTPNIRITIYPDMCVMDAVNESQTSLTKINLTKEWFNVYNVDTEFSVIVNTSILYKIIHVLDTNFPIKVILSTSDLVVEGKSTQSDVIYTIPSLTIDIPIIDVPDDIEYAVDISMNSKTLCNILDHLLIIGETCSIHIKEDSMLFATNGDYGSTKIDLTIDELNSYVVEENIDLQLTYHLKLLHIVSLYHKSSELVDIHIGEDKPLMIQYNMDHKSFIRFMIAPKINED